MVVTLDINPVEPVYYRTIEDVIAERNALRHAFAAIWTSMNSSAATSGMRSDGGKSTHPDGI